MTDRVHFDDLTQINVPCGMLDDDTYKRLGQVRNKQWFSASGWIDADGFVLTKVHTYRQKPEPLVVKAWMNVYSVGLSGGWHASRMEVDEALHSSHRIAVLRKETDEQGNITLHLEDA